MNLTTLKASQKRKWYEEALTYANKVQGGTVRIVHGKLRKPNGSAINHAWVKIVTQDGINIVWDPQKRDFFRAIVYAKRAKEITAEYSLEEARILASQTGNAGPWNTKQRKKFLQRPKG